MTGVLQVSIAGFSLRPFLLRQSDPAAEPGAILAFGLAPWFELLLALLALGSCCVVWGIAAPEWLERLFSKALAHLWTVLLMMGLALLSAAGFAFAILA